MAYKRISAAPINEGGTNATTITNTDGVVYFDGTRFVDTAVGTANQVLTSNGAGSAPTFQNASGGSNSLLFTNAYTAIGSNPAVSYTIPWGEYSNVDTSGMTQAQAQFQLPVSGTISNMYVYVNADLTPPVSNSNTITLYVNMTPTALTVTVPSTPTGTPVLVSDTTHSVAVNAGDLIQWHCTQTTGNSLIGQIVVQFTT